MDVVSVTLDEVLTAAAVRAASLVPETSGYLALAIADASARLPYRIEDEMVSLTTEGTVKVARGSTVVSPQESVEILRDGLARLLAGSVGSMPALVAAARPRDEGPDGVDGYIRELEAALVPVNRAAARRALARLARETARARDAGKLRRRRSKKGRSDAPPRPSARPSAPAPAPPALHAQAPAPAAHIAQAPAAPAVSPAAVGPSGIDQAAIEQAAIDQAAVAQAMEQVRAAEAAAPSVEPQPAPRAALVEEAHAVDVEFSERPPVVEATPTPVEAYREIDDAATTIDAAAAPRRSRREIAREPNGGAALGPCKQSDVDDLLDRFAVSALTDPDAMRATRASLKRLAGLDPTPPPPSVSELKRIIENMPAPKVNRVERAAPASRAPSVESGASRRMPWALVAVGLVVAGLLGHYLPAWLA